MKINASQNNISFKSLASEKIAENIGEYVLKHRRPFKGETLSSSDYKYLMSVVKEKTLPFIEKAEPIKMVLVGFSMKCPSPLKTVSPNADRAEFESLKHLDRFTQGVSSIYPEGAKLDIFADGRMFVGSIFGSTDEKVTKYVSQLKKFLAQMQSTRVKIHTPEDFFSGNFDTVRKSLTKAFPPNTKNMAQDSFIPQYRTFMRDFYAKDIRAQDRNISITNSKKMGAVIADKVINAADSISNFVADINKKGMLRFSVHGHPINATNKKIGLFLNSMNDNCPMPWHAAAIKIPDTDTFLWDKKTILEHVGAKFVPNIDDKGCYYKFDDSFKYDKTKSLKENLVRSYNNVFLNSSGVLSDK